MVELAVNGALEQREEAFDRIGMVEAASTNLLII
jgi:hypothetical protein